MHYMSGGMSNITTGLVNRVFVIVSIKVLLQQAVAEQTGISSGILQYVMMSRVKESREDGFADKFMGNISGNSRERVEIHAKDETGMLADSYNEMEKAIEGTIAELENKTKQQQCFIDNFTHELRTPLTAVVGLR